MVHRFDRQADRRQVEVAFHDLGADLADEGFERTAELLNYLLVRQCESTIAVTNGRSIVVSPGRRLEVNLQWFHHLGLRYSLCFDFLFGFFVADELDLGQGKGRRLAKHNIIILHLAAVILVRIVIIVCRDVTTTTMITAVIRLVIQLATGVLLLVVVILLSGSDSVFFL